MAQENIIHYSSLNGLPHDVTYSIFQDSKGYLWIGTDDGLVKFDGKEFRIFSKNDGLRSNYVIGITENENEEIVLATWGGGIHFVKNDSIIIPEIVNDDVTKLQKVFTIKDDIYSSVSGNSHFFSYSYKKRKLEKEFRFIEKVANEKFRVVKQASDRTVLFNISKFNNQAYAHYDEVRNRRNVANLKGVYRVEKDSLILEYPTLKDEWISSIGNLTEDLIYFGSRNRLYTYANDSIFSNYKIDVENNFIIKAFFGNNTNELIVLASNDKRIKQAYLFNIKTQITTKVSDVYKIQSPISDILKDHEGNIWFSTFGDGVYCIYTTKLEQAYPFQSRLVNTTIKDIEKDKYGNHLVLTDEKLFTISKVRKEIIATIDLFGLGKSVGMFNDSIFISSLTPEDISHNAYTKEIGAYKLVDLNKKGLAEIRQSELVVLNENKHVFIDDNVVFLDAIYHKNRLWISSDKGLFKYNLKDDTYKKMITQRVNKLVEKNDTIWFAINNKVKGIFNDKLFEIKESKNSIKRNINTLFFDHLDQLWIGTQNGVSVYKDGVFNFYSNNTLLSSSFVSTVYEDEENNIWIGGNKGITIIKNNDLQKMQKPPVLNIYQKANSFKVDVISYSRAYAIEWQYKLNDSKWKISNTNEFEYKNYNPGTYNIVFRAKKQNSDWIVSEPYHFKISMPWFKRSWGILIIVLVPSLFILVLINYQLRRSKKRNILLRREIDKRVVLESKLESVRDNIAKDFHDDLGNKLARISILSNLLNDSDNIINSEGKELLEQVINDADYLYKGTKDFIFSLSTQSNNLEELVTYISDFAEDYLKQFNIVFDVEKYIDNNSKLPDYWSKQLLFIFKEIITNVVKHSQCEKVILKFHFENDILTISCLDNGKGFELKQQRLNGLNNIKQRADEIGASLDIHSTLNKGTHVIFTGKTTSLM